MVHSLRWSDTTNQLAGLHDSTLAVWFYPAVAFVDRDLLTLTLWERDGTYVKKFLHLNPHGLQKKYLISLFILKSTIKSNRL